MIRDLSLSKESSKVLASRLKDRNLLQHGTKITFYRTRDKEIVPFFDDQLNFVFCKDIPGVLMKLGAKAVVQRCSVKKVFLEISQNSQENTYSQVFSCEFCVISKNTFFHRTPPVAASLGVMEHSPADWRLFIDSSKRSLKCDLLHITNVYGTIPIVHSTILKEKYDAIKSVLQRIKYNDHQWVICVDLKMVNFLLGQQSGYTKYPCFLCYWGSTDKANHSTKKDWSVKDRLNVGEKNVIAEQLIPRDKIMFPSLHIKLGLMKQFVKALDKDGDCFQYICKSFPSLDNEKLKAGIFDGPQIRQLMGDQK